MIHTDPPSSQLCTYFTASRYLLRTLTVLLSSLDTWLLAPVRSLVFRLFLQLVFWLFPSVYSYYSLSCLLSNVFCTVVLLSNIIILFGQLFCSARLLCSVEILFSMVVLFSTAILFSRVVHFNTVFLFGLVVLFCTVVLFSTVVLSITVVVQHSFSVQHPGYFVQLAFLLRVLYMVTMFSSVFWLHRLFFSALWLVLSVSLYSINFFLTIVLSISSNFSF